MELKNCPFCGGEAHISDLGEGKGGPLVACNNLWSCGLFLTGCPNGDDIKEGETVYEAAKRRYIDKWNTRTPSSSADKLIAAAIACVTDKDTLTRYKATSGDVTGTGCIVNLFDAVAAYQKEQEL